MNRNSMVPFENILDLFFQANAEESSEEPLQPFEEAYERGMVEVIIEVAKTKLLEYEQAIEPTSPKKRQAVDKAIAAFQQGMEQASTQEQKSNLMEIDATYSRCAAIEAEEHFIAGFVMGYRFLKEGKGD
ncbi:MAG: hypothetical protein LRY73_02655 [Bacillus sp. (in: Bacteria)]|nr:hypothetical protein [Bacillus sp. (in: firmicutes)]